MQSVYSATPAESATIYNECQLEKVKAETEKANKLFKSFPTDTLIELNGGNYKGFKLVSDKIGFPLRNSNTNTKPAGEMRLKIQIKKLR